LPYDSSATCARSKSKKLFNDQLAKKTEYSSLMTQNNSHRMLVAGDVQQTMQSIHNWRQARIERASTQRCDSEVLTSARRDGCRRRVRWTRNSSAALSFVLCVVMVPSTICTYSASAEIIASKFRQADNFVAGASKLKKGVSFSCKMDQAVLPGIHKTSAESQDSEHSSNVYIPVHSSSDLERAAGDRLQSMRLRVRDGCALSSSSAARRQSPSSGDETNAALCVYTRLQTQLFPQMRF
jgi:hypothetical protein